MKKSTKHQQTTPLSFRVTDGIDLSSSEMAIPETASPTMQNWYYPKGSSTPEIRPAVVCETTSAAAEPIEFLFNYSNSTATQIMAVSDYNVLYLDGTGWVDTGIDVAKKPTMATFNSKLLIADGTTTLKTWDGTTAGTQTINGTIAPDIVTEISNRVVVNDTSATGLDLVAFSAVEDETEWGFTSSGGAATIRAGYKDGSEVVGLVKNFKNELIVFKQGERSESIYRVQTSGPAYTDGDSQWMAEFVMGGQGCSNAHCVESIDTAVMFLGRYGLSAIVADELYSELNLSAIGKKINSLLGASGNTNLELRYLATSGQLWILRNDQTIYVFHPHNGAFTQYYFGEDKIYSVTETTDGIFFAGESGHLYTLDESEDQDELSPGVYTNIPGIIKTKDFDFGPGRGLIKYSELLFSQNLASDNIIYYLDNTRNIKTEVDSFSRSSTIFDDFMTATSDFYTADDDFMGTDGLPWSQEIRNRFKGKRFQIQINTTGRCGLSDILIHVAIEG